MRKPQVGEIIKITSLEMQEACGSDAFKVEAVFDSIDISEPGGDWGIFGELAWSQCDANDELGQVGEWYVVGSPVNADGSVDDGESWSLASYEAQVD